MTETDGSTTVLLAGAAPSPSSATTTAKTPPRNNYANTHTPIASIKRPRSSTEQNTTPKRSQTSETALSPLHPPTTSSLLRDNTENEIFSPGVLRWDVHDDNVDDVVVDNLDHENHEAVVVAAAQRKVTDDAEDDNLSRQSDASLSVMEIDVDDEFNPWQFIKSLPPYSSVSHLTPPVALDAKDPRFDVTLVLDLDETLVHCTVEAVDDADFCFPVLFHGMEYQVYVRLRPHLFEFLKRIQDLKMETIVFTASQKVYADELLNRIDPGKPLGGAIDRPSAPIRLFSHTTVMLNLDREQVFPSPAVPRVVFTRRRELLEGPERSRSRSGENGAGR
jgi:hypothetical protein